MHGLVHLEAIRVGHADVGYERESKPVGVHHALRVEPDLGHPVAEDLPVQLRGQLVEEALAEVLVLDQEHGQARTPGPGRAALGVDAGDDEPERALLDVLAVVRARFPQTAQQVVDDGRPALRRMTFSTNCWPISMARR